MTSQRWQDLDRLFHSALERPPEERAGFLAEACGTDEAVRQKVEALIAAHEQIGEFLDAPAFEVTGSKLTLEQPSPLANRILGHYKILATLGAGGMGEVYLAQDTRLGRKIALKLLPPEFTIDAERLQRFEQEARAASALSHPNVCVIHEIGYTEEGRRFITMEYIEGATLRQRLAEKRLTLLEALDVAVQIAAGLAAAHAVGIIHRDIKPENVMLRSDGLVKVLDFGLAKLTQQTSETDADTLMRSMVKTGSGMIMGTVGYMSPEQARGLAVDSRTDIWSLGVLLYEMIAGRAPFDGATPSDLLVSILERDPLAISQNTLEVPAELERIVRKALRKDRDERYQTAEDFLVDLKSLRHELAIGAEVARYQKPIPTSEPANTTSDRTANTSQDHSVWFTRSRILILGGIAGLLLVAALVSARLLRQGSTSMPQTEIKSLAVLPFKPLSTDSRNESLEMGMAETLITKLGAIKQIVVRPMSAVRKYTDPHQDPVTAGRELQATAVLDGSIQKAGERVRVTVRLMNTGTGEAVWAEQFDADFTDIFEVQDSISERVTTALALELSAGERGRLTKRHTDNSEAYQLYLQGHYFFGRQTGDRGDNLMKSFEYYQRAIEKDPNFALAYIGMAQSYLALTGNTRAPAQEVIPKAVANMTKALELDPMLAEARNTLAEIKYQFEYDWQGAEKEFKRAIELNPTAARIHLAYGWFLMTAGRFEEARAEMEKAQELDPSSMGINRSRGRLLFFMRQYDQAIEHYRKIVELDPSVGSNHWSLARTYELKGMYAEAIEGYAKYNDIIRLFRPEEMQQYREIVRASGWQVFAQKIAADMEEKAKKEYVSPVVMAQDFARADNKDRAFVWLEKALEARDPALVQLKIEPVYDSLRSDPRYIDLLRRINLTP